MRLGLRKQDRASPFLGWGLGMAASDQLQTFSKVYRGVLRVPSRRNGLAPPSSH